MRLFLYAYTLADAPHDFDEIVGVEEGHLFMLTYGRVSAIVSAYSMEKVSLRGQDVFAHQHAQRLLLSQATIIPLHYGLTLPSSERVLEVLEANETSLFTELSRLYRKVEMEVTMSFNVPDLFDHLVLKYPYLRDEKSKVVNGRLLYHLGDRAKKGAKFQHLLGKEKEIYRSQLEEVIGPWCAEIRASKLPLAEKDVVTFNCLVNRERLRVFEKSIYDASDRFGDDFHFSFNGPWVPQNFCDRAVVSYKK